MVTEADDGNWKDLYEQQADATVTTSNPGSGTKYTILDTTENVRITSIAAKVTWSVQPTSLEVHVTIDGQSITFSQADPASGTVYRAAIKASAAATAQDFVTTAADDIWIPYMLEGKSVKVEAEITGGTVSELFCRVKYAKK